MRGRKPNTISATSQANNRLHRIKRGGWPTRQPKLGAPIACSTNCFARAKSQPNSRQRGPTRESFVMSGEAPDAMGLVTYYVLFFIHLESRTLFTSGRATFDRLPT